MGLTETFQEKISLIFADTTMEEVQSLVEDAYKYREVKENKIDLNIMQPIITIKEEPQNLEGQSNGMFYNWNITRSKIYYLSTISR